MSAPEKITPFSLTVLVALNERQPCGARAVAGQLAIRSQEAGRQLAALEREGFAYFDAPLEGGAGWRLTDWGVNAVALAAREQIA